MRRSRHLRATRLGRWLRGRIPDRNPLRRRTDRLETAFLAFLLIMLAVTAPLVAVAASNWEHAASLREMRAQATYRQVRATLLDNAKDTGSYPMLTAEATVRWTAPSGPVVTELMWVPENAKAGAVIWIWTNPAGQFVTPLLPADVPTRDGLAAAAALLSAVAVALLAGLTVHRTLNRSRMSAWGMAWKATEPRWNTRR